MNQIYKILLLFAKRWQRSSNTISTINKNKGTNTHSFVYWHNIFVLRRNIMEQFGQAFYATRWSNERYYFLNMSFCIAQYSCAKIHKYWEISTKTGIGGGILSCLSRLFCYDVAVVAGLTLLCIVCIPLSFTDASSAMTFLSYSFYLATHFLHISCI